MVLLLFWLTLFDGLLGWVWCAVCVEGAACLGLRSAGRWQVQVGSLGNSMLELAGDDARATFVVAESPKMILAWSVPMASRKLPLSLMTLTELTSLGDQRGVGILR